MFRDNGLVSTVRSCPAALSTWGGVCRVILGAGDSRQIRASCPRDQDREGCWNPTVKKTVTKLGSFSLEERSLGGLELLIFEGLLGKRRRVVLFSLMDES